MQRFLFVCSRNKLRGPTAEQLFSDWPGLEVDSAGTNSDAIQPLSPELLAWADTIFVMERVHRNKVQRKYRRFLDGKRIICLDIPDDYAFMDSGLIDLLNAKIRRFLPMKPVGTTL